MHCNWNKGLGYKVPKTHQSHYEIWALSALSIYINFVKFNKKAR